MATRQFYVPAWLFVLVVLALVANSFAGVYFAFFEPAYMVYTNSPFPVLNPKEPGQVIPKIARGIAVRLLVGRCSTDSGPRIYPVARRLVGPGKPIIIKATDAPIEPGCSENESRITEVPLDAPVGVYFVDGYAEIDGALRHNIVPWQSQQFEVVP